MAKQTRILTLVAFSIAAMAAGSAKAEDAIQSATACSIRDAACLSANFEAYKSATLDVVSKWSAYEPRMNAALAIRDQMAALDIFREATGDGLSGRYKTLANTPDDATTSGGIDASEFYFVDTCRIAAVGAKRIATSMATARWADAELGVHQFTNAIADCETHFKLAVPAGGFDRPAPNPIALAE